MNDEGHSNPRTVWLAYGTDKPLGMEIKCPNKLTVAQVKEFFPKANGVIYYENKGLESEKKMALTIGPPTNPDHYILKEGIDDYEVHISKDFKNEKDSTIKKRVHDILATLRQPADCSEGRSPAKIGKKCEKKKIEVKFLRRNVLSRKNKFCAPKKMKTKTIDLILDYPTHYTAVDIQNMAIDEFKKMKDSQISDAVSITLGTYDGQPIKHFTIVDSSTTNVGNSMDKINDNKQDENGNEICGIWDHYKSRHKPCTRIKLYLLASFNTHELFDSDGEDYIDNKLKPNVLISKAQKTLQDQINNKFKDDHMALPVKQKFVNNAININIADLSSESEDDENFNAMNSQDDVFIKYFYIKFSSYGENNPSICYIDKKRLYKHLKHTEGLVETFEEFNPVQHDCSISSIEIGSKTYLNVEILDNLKQLFTFPSANKSIPEHEVLHNLSELKGTFDNKAGMGTITRCTDECEPHYSWYRDDVLYEKERFLYWITIDDASRKWRCEVTCKAKFVAQIPVNPTHQVTTSKPISNTNIPNRRHTIEVSLPHIGIDDFEIYKDKIGGGSQGFVSKGKWNGKDIAVKTIRTLSPESIDIKKELLILDKMNHENIIKFYGYCLLPKKVHFLMEYFDSQTLADVLLDDDLAEEYYITKINIKIIIADQICQAIRHLHDRVDPILHRDIKPENVLVNKLQNIKLCDFGLSTSMNIPTNLRTSKGRTFKGTSKYVAPEVWIDKQVASTSSEIWSIACTLYELFSRTLVWGSINDDALLVILKGPEVPDFESPEIKDLFPTQLKAVLKKCFERVPSKRPNIFDIMKVVNEFSRV